MRSVKFEYLVDYLCSTVKAARRTNPAAAPSLFSFTQVAVPWLQLLLVYKVKFHFWSGAFLEHLQQCGIAVV